MENSNSRRRSSSWLVLGLSMLTVLSILLLFFSNIAVSDQKIPARRILGTNNIAEQSTFALQIRLETLKNGQVVIMSNGLVEVTFSNPGGDLIGIKYNGIDNLLEIHNAETNRGYWDIVWGEQAAAHFAKLQGTEFKIIKQNKQQIEISFSTRWSNCSGQLPISVDKRYIMLRNYPGFYTYGIFEHPKEGGPAYISDLRVAFKLQQDLFQYMAVSDDRRRIMPSVRDRATGQRLAYPEAVLLTNPSNPRLKGEVDDKYQYSSDHKDVKVHGWISSKPSVGFWVITPTMEFLTGGPMKQELTSHVGPTSLAMFMSCHYAGTDMIMKLDRGEYWKKVLGPTPIYLNSIDNNNYNYNYSKEDYHQFLWENAKKQARKEAAKWPYNFIHSKDLPPSDQRGIVTGQLLVRDRYIKESLFEAKFAYVGLGPPGEAGSWQRENKGYQFWVKADEEGNFTIKNVRPGKYSLYAFVPGIIGDYALDKTITIKPGSKIELDSIVYEPPRNGPTLWEIGVPDRTAAEYYIPYPLPTRTNRVLDNKFQDKFRQYGLWDRYTDKYPNHDLIYTVNRSDYRRDWFFAHVCRKLENGTYQDTTWRVNFNLESPVQKGSYTLRIALASITATDLLVGFNEARPVMSTHLIGKDNAIARHGVHGLYWLFSVNVEGNILREGKNTLYLTQSRSIGPFGGLMYDYIRFEAPSE